MTTKNYYVRMGSMLVISTFLFLGEGYAKGDKGPRLEVNDEVSLSHSATKKEKHAKVPKVFSDEQIEKKLQEFSASATSEKIKNIEELKKIQQTNTEKIYANKIATNQELAKMYREGKTSNATERRELFEKLSKKKKEMREYERGLNDELRDARKRLLGEGPAEDKDKRKY